MACIYLCGAIMGCTNHEANDWRTAAMTAMHGEHTFLDPMVRDYRHLTEVAYREIVELDKRDIRNADILLVNHPGPSTGTDMEILYAWTLGIPVVAVVPEGAQISPWLRYHCTKLAMDFQEARDWITRVTA